MTSAVSFKTDDLLNPLGSQTRQTMYRKKSTAEMTVLNKQKTRSRTTLMQL